MILMTEHLGQEWGWEKQNDKSNEGELQCRSDRGSVRLAGSKNYTPVSHIKPKSLDPCYSYLPGRAYNGNSVPLHKLMLCS
jgi:hypothetical protein